MDKQKRNTRQARYRHKESRARLELMVTPALLERFRALAGLEGKTNAEKLEALCDVWDAQKGAYLLDQALAASLALEAELAQQDIAEDISARPSGNRPTQGRA